MVKNRIKLLTVFGTRPEAIKMAPLVQAFKGVDINIMVCITAQHREMLDQVMDFFEITANYDLDLMKPSQSLNQLSSRILSSFDNILCDTQPDWVMVHGDTTTSAMCALAAFHRGIKIAHVEAGLRTFNKLSPFPEEINRQFTGRIADLHFSPTESAKNNLLKEGILDTQILVTGNTVIDALQLGLEKIEGGATSVDLQRIQSIVNPLKRTITITGHRRENFGEGFEKLCEAIKEISLHYRDVQFIYPVHLNPHVQEPVNRILGNLPQVHLISPLDYPAFIYLMQQSYLILTDSGGVQEEAPSLGKPVIVLRDTTERPEAVEAGTVKLVGTEINRIIRQIRNLLDNPKEYQLMSRANNPYGDGQASSRIVQHFKNMMV